MRHENRIPFNRPQTRPSHPISDLTRVCHSLGISLNTLLKAVRLHPRIAVPNSERTFYGCGAAQVSQAATFPDRPRWKYGAIHQVVCEVIEELTSKPPEGIALSRAVGPYLGPYKATQENWPKMFNDRIRYAEPKGEPNPMPFSKYSKDAHKNPPPHELRVLLKAMNLTFEGLSKRVGEHPRIKELEAKWFCIGYSASQISGAAWTADKEAERGSKPGWNYQPINEVVCLAISDILGGKYPATVGCWPRMTEEMRRGLVRSNSVKAAD